MVLRIGGSFLIILGLIAGYAAFVLAGPQPALDADDLATNMRVFLFFTAATAIFLMSGLITLLASRKK